MTDDGKCGAKTRTGGTCQKGAGWGTDHAGYGNCKLHGGLSPNGVKHGAKLAAVAEYRNAHALGVGQEVDIDPLDALLWCVRVAATEVRYYSAKIAELDHDDVVGNPRSVKTRPLSEGKDGEDPSITVQEVTEAAVAPNIFVELRHAALDRLAKFSKMALDAGVDERRVQIAERYGEVLARLIGGILDDLLLTAAQQEQAPVIVRRHLALLEAAA